VRRRYRAPVAVIVRFAADDRLLIITTFILENGGQ